MKYSMIYFSIEIVKLFENGKSWREREREKNTILRIGHFMLKVLFGESKVWQILEATLQ